MSSTNYRIFLQRIEYLKTLIDNKRTYEIYIREGNYTKALIHLKKIIEWLRDFKETSLQNNLINLYNDLDIENELIQYKKLLENRNE